jgi:tRNA(adenine34) deaminase
MVIPSLNEKWMQAALVRAKQAQVVGEVPVGAIIVLDNEIIGEGWNGPISGCDPTAHAEMIAIRQAAKRVNNYRLLSSTLYVTLEPCAMCAGAMIQARVQKLVFGAYDPRAGAAGSVFNIFQNKDLNHKIDFIGGILAEECGLILRQFFEARRKIAKF